ncbi:hypothetical protein [Prauserella cavernicola]|uniref:2'-5' RNA ligase n=1 Tax=Prauserella cavernicola TaxID=2800127 RepID=A0A934QNF3_9PSEU|nr:hypothetical protein [Prauserella cavernicola]MBK1782779.1 hypothetical protein [Prauserella cavernicola]
MVRLAFAVRPPEAVREVVAALPRPALPGATWSVPEQWIVKLRPLGHVAGSLRVPLLEAAAAALDGAPATRARLGPATHRLAGQWLSVPVSGLDELAADVFAATTPLVPVTHPQPFRGELVLARGRLPRHVAGAAVDASWLVTEVLLVADQSAPCTPRLRDVGVVPLAE